MRRDREAEEATFERELAAFERLKPSLMEQYAGQYVAVSHGKVVASGNVKLDVARKVRERYGAATFYVGRVTMDAPRTVRMPSVQARRRNM